MEDINNREKKKFDAGEYISTYTKEHYDSRLDTFLALREHPKTWLVPNSTFLEY